MNYHPFKYTFNRQTFFILYFYSMGSLGKTICIALLAILGGCFWEETESNPSYLPMDDSEYPYAGIPRVVIETENFEQIRNREKEIPAHLQIYGKDDYESEVLDLTVRGRGNSSFHMPKYGMKLEFTEKQKMFGMPKSRDWALIANYGDKTHLRNFMAARLSEWLGAKFTPKAEFVELYFNRKYMGLYLFSETVKVAKNRVNIPENDESFLVEKEDDKKIDEPFITSDMGHLFHIKSPKNVSEKSRNLLLNHINSFEKVLFSYAQKLNAEQWIDLSDFLLFYWIQEFSKNEDGRFSRSVFFTWENGGLIHFGPIWDFDLAFGNASESENKDAEDWYIRYYKWYYHLLRRSDVDTLAQNYWLRNKAKFHELIDSIPLYESHIRKAIDNEYKRWPILQNTENWALKDPYATYEEAIDSMRVWMQRRYDWINDNL